MLSTWDTDFVRWCGPYADDILHHHLQKEEKTQHYEMSERDRRIVVNWICNVSRREQYKSETFWTAVATFDRCMNAFDEGKSGEEEGEAEERKRFIVTNENVQSIAAACIHLSATFQETALSPSLEALVITCNERYSKEELREKCWLIVQVLGADLYWPTPLTFYRHFSHAMNQTVLEHTMTKFVIETIAFSRDDLLSEYAPSFLALCALFIAQWCVYEEIPHTDWILEWRKRFKAEERSKGEEEELFKCLKSLFCWMSCIVNHGESIETEEIESVLRRYAHEELFCVSKIASLPANTAQLDYLICNIDCFISKV